MPNIRLAAKIRNDMLDVIRSAIQSTGGATISLYSGDQPADPDQPVTGALLGSMKFGKKPIGQPSGCVLMFDGIEEAPEAEETGLATWARVVDAHGDVILDCDVGGTREGSRGTIQLNTAEIVAGGPISLARFSLSYRTA